MKNVKIQGMSNGLVLHVVKASGETEGFIVANDGSEAYKQFRAAFDAASETPAEHEQRRTEEQTVSDPHEPRAEHRHQPEDPQRGQAGGGDLDEWLGGAIHDAISWLNSAEKKRHERRT